MLCVLYTTNDSSEITENRLLQVKTIYNSGEGLIWDSWQFVVMKRKT